MIALVRFMKNNIDAFNLKRLENSLRRVATIQEPFLTSLGAAIINQGHDRNNIVIGNNCRIQGVIVCAKTGKITIGQYTAIMQDVKIQCASSITIGSFCGIASNTLVVDNNNHPIDIEGRIAHRIRVAPGGEGYQGESFGWEIAVSDPVDIKDGVWIGSNCSIMKGVTIGEGAIVARGSIVTKDVEPHTIVAGNPAKMVKRLPIPDCSVAELGEKILTRQAVSR